ncbi:MAG: lipopolysaccharide biosynthesis protein RfbH [Candidatus Ancillula sp.]|jgi:CDP-6-deoxy-D-xylo-4-hexulose-3-dehydrase|nr:lipopolysaccharide biosynthesis protein RfbH [Candidatus Ancillula sp.]
MTTREEILRGVRGYGEAKCAAEESKGFVPGESFISTGGKVVDAQDLVNMVDSVLDGWFTSGRYHDEFEQKLAAWVGVQHCAFVNSGSSANLNALAALTSPKLGKRQLLPGDEVITPVAGFPTTINPILQLGLKPVFVDVELGTYDAVDEQIVSLVEQSHSEGGDKKIKAIMMAHTLGNPFNVTLMRELCDKYGLWLVEDACDALGTTIDGKRVGTFGDLATASFYPAHHITTGEGGAVFCNNGLLAKEVKSFRDWGRACWCDTGHDNACGKRFDWQLGKLPKGYDHKYTYDNIGYNLKATDIQAALGVSQLDKIDNTVSTRHKNGDKLYTAICTAFGVDAQALENGEHLTAGPFVMPVVAKNVNLSWFGFPLTLDPSRPELDREDLIQFLNSRKIGTRLVFASNILRQPAYVGLVEAGRARTFGGGNGVDGDFPNADVVTNRSFWLGTHPNLSDEMITFMADSLKEWVNGQ